MNLTTILWNRFARWLVRNPARVDWLIARAKRTPYFDLTDYMNRWWLVSPSRWLPFSIRIHHIQREGAEVFPHNHPWNFRTIVLRGAYIEQLFKPDGMEYRLHAALDGSTFTRSVSEYHRIAAVSEDGVWTLFIMGRKRCKWGFMVNGQHVYWREYLGEWEGA